MPFYLSQFIGTGTKADPFRPAGADQSPNAWSVIDLRPDGGATLGGGGLNACLLWTEVPVSDPAARLLANSKDDPLSNPNRNFVQSRLGVDLTGVTNTFSEIAGAIMRNPPATNRWGVLLPTNGRFQIWLGELIYDVPA